MTVAARESIPYDTDIAPAAALIAELLDALLRRGLLSRENHNHQPERTVVTPQPPASR
jgi:hypothetical protein